MLTSWGGHGYLKERTFLTPKSNFCGANLPWLRSAVELPRKVMGAEFQDGCREAFWWLWFHQGCGACLSHGVLWTPANTITPASPCALGKYLLWDIKILKRLVTKPSHPSQRSMESGISILQKSWFQAPLLIETATMLKKKEKIEKKIKKKTLFFIPLSENLADYLGGNKMDYLKNSELNISKIGCLLTRVQVRSWLPTNTVAALN